MARKVAIIALVALSGALSLLSGNPAASPGIGQVFTAASPKPGDLDPTFDGDGKVLTVWGNGSSVSASDVVIQADRKVVVAGSMTPADRGTGDSFAVVRYTVNGALDPAFDSDGKVQTEFAQWSFDRATSLTTQSDGKILVAGWAYDIVGGTGEDFALVRYNANGSLDGSFDGDGKMTTDFERGRDVGLSVAIQSDGKIVVAGYSSPSGNAGGSSDYAVARYNRDGSLDATFDGDGRVVTTLSARDRATTVAVQADGKIVVGGQLETGSPAFTLAAGLVRYLPDGSLDSSFDGDGKLVLTMITSIRDLAVQPDGKILAAGSGFGVTRFNSNGALDTTFDGQGNSLFQQGGVEALALQRDGRTIIVGPVGYPASDFAVARFDARGAVDSSFHSEGTVTTDFGGMDIPFGVALGSNGEIVVAGGSGPAGGAGPNDLAVARYLNPPPCKVPNVRGKMLPAARSAITKAQCSVGKVRRKSSNKVKRGRVISQSPKARTTLPNLGKVNLVVSRGRR